MRTVFTAPSRKLAYGKPTVAPPTAWFCGARYGWPVWFTEKLYVPPVLEYTVDELLSKRPSPPNLYVWLSLVHVRLMFVVGFWYISGCRLLALPGPRFFDPPCALLMPWNDGK